MQRKQCDRPRRNRLLHNRILKKKEVKKYVKWMGNAVCALSILFILSAFARIDFQTAVMGRDWKLLLPACAAGVTLKAMTVFLSGSAWRRWLEFFSGKRCDRREALRVYAKANIGKYLPGNVMHYVERNLFAGKLNLSQKQIAAASLLEVISLTAAAVSLGALLAFPEIKDKELAAELFGKLFSDGGNRAALLAVGFLAAACLIVVAGAIYKHYRGQKKSETAGPVLSGEAKEVHFSRKKLRVLLRIFMKSYVSYAAVLCILGLILALLYWFWAGMPEFHFQQAAFMVAAYSIAWALGFIIPGAPGGIGVREMALTVMLAPAIGQDAVVAVSILHRAVTVIGDFAAYLLRRVPGNS